jgi:hypothetical protein
MYKSYHIKWSADPSGRAVSGRSPAEIVGSNPTRGVDVCLFVCCECYVLSGRGFCDGLITRPEGFYRMWRVEKHCVSKSE